MSKTATDVKWERYDDDGSIIYQGNGFYTRVFGVSGEYKWLARVGGELVHNAYAPDFATAKRDAERWILEHEGRLSASVPAPAPAPATDGGWIPCSERMPEVGVEVEMICRGALLPEMFTGLSLATTGPATRWRPIPVDPHAAAACLFSDRYRPTVEQARAAARHVAGCDECLSKLK